MARNSYFKNMRKAAQAELAAKAEEAKRDKKLRELRDFYASVLGMPPEEALAFARDMLK